MKQAEVYRRVISKVGRLRQKGFDHSRTVPFEGATQVGCSQCAAAVVNGVACHEHGCPNARVGGNRVCPEGES